MIKPTVFIGSSVDGLLYAQCLAKILNKSKKYTAIDWGEYFRYKAGGKISLDALYEALRDYDVALFFVTKDYFVDYSKIDASKKLVRDASSTDFFGTRPNVWFELGMFMGRISEEKALFLVEENEASTRTIMTLSDLYGLNPLQYKLDENIKNEIIEFSKDCQNSKPKREIYLHDFNIISKSKLELSMQILFKKQFANPLKFKNEPKYYTVQSLFSEDECYEQGFKMIREADRRIFSIISYEDSRTSNNQKYRDGLWPEIRKKINAYKSKKKYPKAEFKSIFKRYMNVANNKIYDQAKSILAAFSHEIEIRDTYCNYIEVLITDDKVLIVLPNQTSKQINVDAGIVIHSKKVADEFGYWFTELLPEPNSINLDSVKKLNTYRDLVWTEPSQRKDVNGSRCNGCFIKFDKQPDIIKDLLKQSGLK